jgi:hypothetical protein
MFIKMAKFTAATIISIASTRTGLGQEMAGQQAMAPRAPSAEESAEPAISATSSEQNVMGKLLALTALVSLRLQF